MIQEPTQTLPVPPTPPTPGPHTVVVQTPMPPNLPPWVTLPPSVTLLVALGFFAACAVILYPLARAIARRLEGRSSPDPALRTEVEQLRHRLEDVEGVQH